MITNTSENKTFSVSELNRRVKDLLEVHLPLIWVEGELSNFSRPASGHWYFTLKDEQAQVRCAMFRGRNNYVKFAPKNGDHIRLRARVSLYEGRGDYQLIGEHMEDAGFGLLQRRFDELKNKLAAEGLFDEGFKKPLPANPKHIGLITSSTGAALRDVLHVLKRRSPATQITLFPTAVQGENAPAEIIAAMDQAREYAKCDLLILCRGGGSIEDLWAFNSEALARVIFACDTPTISAVGHEIDFTIADFVADVRAPTPSAAAEIAATDVEQHIAQLRFIQHRLVNAMNRRLQQWQHQLQRLHGRIRHPGDKIQAWSQRLDRLDNRLRSTWQQQLNVKSRALSAAEKALHAHNPQHRLADLRHQLISQRNRLKQALHNQLKIRRLTLANTVHALDLVSPLATLKRGYAIVKDEQNHVIKSAAQIRAQKNTALTLTFSDGDVPIHTE